MKFHSKSLMTLYSQKFILDINIHILVLPDILQNNFTHQLFTIELMNWNNILDNHMFVHNVIIISLNILILINTDFVINQIEQILFLFILFQQVLTLVLDHAVVNYLYFSIIKQTFVLVWFTIENTELVWILRFIVLIFNWRCGFSLQIL